MMDRQPQASDGSSKYWRFALLASVSSRLMRAANRRGSSGIPWAPLGLPSSKCRTRGRTTAAGAACRRRAVRSTKYIWILVLKCELAPTSADRDPAFDGCQQGLPRRGPA